MPDPRVAVVMVTRDRRERVLASLRRLIVLPERPDVIVVDNGSRDGTVAAVRNAYPNVDCVALGRNAGGAGRTVGVTRTRRPFVAFADDDSWWAPGALSAAADTFERHPRLALIAARVLVGEEERVDPLSRELARSPLGRPDRLPGPAILGFAACGAIVRRLAFLETEGFHPRFGIGGEEELLALDLRARGWDLAYVDTIVAHHHPAPGVRPGRSRGQLRNALWTAWLRRSPPVAVCVTARALIAGLRDDDSRAATFAATAGLRWIVTQRRPLPPDIEQEARAVTASAVEVVTPAGAPRR